MVLWFAVFQLQAAVMHDQTVRRFGEADRVRNLISLLTLLDIPISLSLSHSFPRPSISSRPLAGHAVLNALPILPRLSVFLFPPGLCSFRLVPLGSYILLDSSTLPGSNEPYLSRCPRPFAPRPPSSSHVLFLSLSLSAKNCVVVVDYESTLHTTSSS